MKLDIPDTAWIPPVAKRALEILAKQCDELEDRNRDLAGANRVLSEAIRDIEAACQQGENVPAAEPERLVDALNAIYHIVRTGGVRTALEASA